MTDYTLMVNRKTGQKRLIKEGWNWSAYIFGWWWLLVKGHIIVAGTYAVIYLFLWWALISHMGLFGALLVGFGLPVYLGVYASHIEKIKMWGKGFESVKIIYGANNELDAWNLQQEETK